MNRSIICQYFDRSIICQYFYLFRLMRSEIEEYDVFDFYQLAEELIKIIKSQ